MNIRNIDALTDEQHLQAAQILTDSLPQGWSTLARAQSELAKWLILENVLLAMVEQHTVIGFGGILPIYGGHVYELHPLAVRADRRGEGIGSLLVSALEAVAKSQGGLTVWLGADDESEPSETSFGGVDLYDNFPKRLEQFKAGTHQTAFYLKLGYTVMGALPNANGKGKPDIFMAKDISK